MLGVRKGGLPSLVGKNDLSENALIRAVKDVRNDVRKDVRNDGSGNVKRPQ